MKFLIYLIFLITQLQLISAEVTVFDQWDQVALVEIKNGEATIFLLHCSDKIKPNIDLPIFEAEVKKWAHNLKDMTFIYALAIQEGQKKSATWEITQNTFLEMKKFIIIIRDAKVKSPLDKPGK